MSTELVSPPELESLDATVIVNKLDLLPEAGVDKKIHPKTTEIASCTSTTNPAPAPAPAPKSTQPSSKTKPAPIESLDDGAALMQEAERTLLRSRLQTATIICLFCMTAFFLRSLFIDEPIVFIIRSVSMIMTVGCLGLLMTPQRLTTHELRRIELLLFGPLCVLIVFLEFFFLVQAARAGNASEQVGVVMSGTLGLAVMMLTYGMLMPNGWRRTALMMVPPVVATTVILTVARNSFPSVAESIDEIRMAEAGLALILTGVIATYGTYTISTLRREANRAKQLGRYRLKRELGTGGMGQVHLGEHQLLKRPCAVKVIRPGQVVDRAALARFEREVQTTARLSHWNTIEIFDYGHTEDGTFYYVMEYMRGLSLADLVKRYGPQTPGRSIHFLTQTCWALQEAHNHGLIHRDLKPANIFAAKRGGVFDVTKLFDFGLVLLRGEGDNFLNMVGPSGTTPFAGSPLYMSPEQAVGLKLDARSDIYSLGGVAYYLLTGRPPFEGDSAWRVMVAHAKEPVTPPSRWNPSIPKDLEAVVMRCLSKEPGDRYESPRELAEALGACQAAGSWNYELANNWWRERAAEIDPTLLDP
jgi:tRNA A-37 threonylcarbamoyl transferase component Bud32